MQVRIAYNSGNRWQWLEAYRRQGENRIDSQRGQISQSVMIELQSKRAELSIEPNRNDQALLVRAWACCQAAVKLSSFASIV
jgi:hypothetical protein